MKRTALKRKTAMRRSTKPLKRSPLRKVSVKRRAEARLYTVVRERFLAEHPWCQACWRVFGLYPARPACQVHHARGRGKLLNEELFFMAVCMECHTWIEDNKKAARAMGLILYK